MRRSIRNKMSVTTSSDPSDDEECEKLIAPSKSTNDTEDSNDNEKDITAITPNRSSNQTEDSSSESDIENYLQPISEINLNSKFFQIEKSSDVNSFESIEKDIFAGTNRLSDSESDEDQFQQEKTAATSKLNFDQLHSYAKKLEEVKQLIQTYEAKKKTKEKKGQSSNDDISNLLALGEMQVDVPDNRSIHSSDFMSCSEDEDWEEVEDSVIKPSTSKVNDGIQITVALPDNMRKKKGVDLVASMKRRLNRIKKENQVLIHKVHLLCWIAHGNYVNTVLNNEDILGLSLSLIPSDHCYPPERTDLTYLEQISNWYHKLMGITDKLISKQWSLQKVLKLQLARKQAYNKKMFVYMFICILRSLGIQCRLVLSFQVLPLRPQSSELHSLSTKTEKQNSERSISTNSKDIKSPAASGDKRNVEKKTTGKIPSKTQIKQSTVDRNKNKENVDKPKLVDSINSKDIKSPGSSNDKNSVKKTISEKNPSKNKVKHEIKNTEGNKKVREKVKKEENKTIKSKENADKTNIKLVSKQKHDSVKAEKGKNTEKTVNLKSLSKSKSEKSTKEASKPTRTRSKKSIVQLDGANDSSHDEFEKPKKLNLKKLAEEKKSVCSKNHPRRLKKPPKYEERSSSSEEDCDEVKKTRLVNLQALKNKIGSRSSLTLPSKSKDIRNDIISIMKTRMKQEKAVTRSKLVKKRKSKSQLEEDSDYAPEGIPKKYDSDDDFRENKVKVKRRIEVKSNSADSEKTRKGMDVWVEIFLEDEEKWISVDIVKNQVHCVNQLYSRASHPVSYIVAWNNNNSIKDVTQRYCTNWNTTTRKLRIDSRWWTKTLKPYLGTKTARDREEDEELAQQQLDKPLPLTITEYKDHPLYVLKRHLLKFQALYPPDLPPLGFVRNEPVYARECVHVLHSREIWIKEAKTVKPGEQPYKIVKARPKYDRLSGKVISDLPLEVFGIWQVEDYIPPTAENGVVPRNAYGNVELFKSCMLPKGTVHLQLPGLNKVARKMNMDCVPAVVGFDFHSGWNHPTFDGFVVCEENSEVLVAAWFQEQEEQEKRDQEKIEKRVYGNWRKLIKGLLIRERLKQRYDYGEPSQTESKGRKRKSKGPKLLSKKRRICSDSESN